MIYGLYLSASGVISASHRQDVIANNLANAETNGFKRALALVQERRPAGGDPMLDEIGGGLFLSPTRLDLNQGTLQASESPLHLAIVGEGYFAVGDGGETRLTRNGTFMLDREGTLILADGSGRPVLNHRQRQIRLDATRLAQTAVNPDGTITVENEPVARIGTFTVADPGLLTPVGGTMFATNGQRLSAARQASVQSGWIEASNVDPALELTKLMEAQRQLEANANMIRYQDQALGRLVNDVGKIS